jgi:hypothetical protein
MHGTTNAYFLIESWELDVKTQYFGYLFLFVIFSGHLTFADDSFENRVCRVSLPGVGTI